MTTNSKDMYHKMADYAYIAGLFDGEGCVQYKQYLDTKRKDRPKRYKVWRISMETVSYTHLTLPTILRV